MAWMNNRSHLFMWDVITHPCSNFAGGGFVECRVGVSDHMAVIRPTYKCPNHDDGLIKPC